MRSGLTHRQGATTGVGIGILHIDSSFPLARGHIQDARTLGVPLVYECAQGVTPRQIVACDPAAEAAIIDAARRLQHRGVGAVIGVCGSFVNFHSALVDALDIPVFSSVMLAVPMLLRSMSLEKKLAVIFASADSFSDRVARQAGIDDRSRLIVSDCRSLPAFAPILGNSPDFNSEALHAEFIEHVDQLLCSFPEVGQIVLQCSELAPYAALVRERFQIPVFDINSLARWVNEAVIGGTS